MIHYSCDLCKREIDTENDQRFVIRVDISQDIDPAALEAADDDRDYLDEMQDALQRLGDDEYAADLVDKQLCFDLCSECARKFAKNPLGAGRQIEFSEN